MQLTNSLALATLALASAPPAAALALAEGTISNVYLTLEDLAPDDSVVPGFTFSGLFAEGRVTANGGGVSSLNEFKTFVHLIQGSLDALPVTAPVPSSYAASAETLFPGGPTGSLNVKAFSNVLKGTSEAYAAVSYGIQIPPHSLLNVGATFNTYAISIGSPQSGVGQGAAVGGSVQLYVPFYGTYSTPIFGAGAFDWQVPNNGDTPLSATLTFLLNAQVQNAVVTVPEPGPAALLLAGLAVVAGVRRRGTRPQAGRTEGTGPKDLNPKQAAQSSAIRNGRSPRHPAAQRLRRSVSAFAAATALLAGTCATAQTTSYADRQAEFVADTGASSIGTLPFGALFPATVGLVTFNHGSEDLTGGFANSSNELLGNDVSIGGYESFTMTIASGAHAIGFKLHEPGYEGPASPVTGCNSPCADSTFSIEVFAGATSLGRFEYNAPDDVSPEVGGPVGFFGVRSLIAFDRIEVREIGRNIDNEYFGEFVLSPVPEPSIWALLLAGLGVIAFSRNRTGAVGR